jgi:hypothetical protein
MQQESQTCLMMTADVVIDIKVVYVHNVVQCGIAGVVAGDTVQDRGLLRT